MATNPFAAALAREDMPGRALPRPNPIAAATARADARPRDVPTRADRDRVISSLTRPTGQVPPPPPQLTTAGVAAPFSYPAVLPPLSPEMQRAFEERRRAATRAYEEAQAATERQRLMAEGGAVQGRRQVAQQQGEESRTGMTQLAGRGLARSPMFVNPFQRGVARVAQQRLGELETGLAGTLENLRTTLQDAAAARESELARIETDILAARSNIPRLLGVE